MLLHAPPGLAAAHSQNRAAARAFITADYAFLQSSYARLKLIRRRTEAEKRKIAHECGGLGSGSPQDHQSYLLSYEVAGALWAVSYGAQRKQIDALERTVSALHWSNEKLGRRARAYAGSLHALAHLAPPDVCADLADWKASHFETLPARTSRFDKRVEAIEVVTVPPSLLSRYVAGPELAIAHRSGGLQRRLLNFETAVGGSIWYSLLEALRLNPGAGN